VPKIEAEIIKLKRILLNTKGHDYRVLQYVISNLERMVADKK